MKKLYDGLRLSCGGGVHVCEKIAQAKNTATLVIGIGGTGIDALRMVKKTVYDNVKPDNWEQKDSERSQYGNINFLAIDSERCHIGNPLPEMDLSQEFFELDRIPLMGGHEPLPPHLNWLNSCIPTLNLKNGAGGIRQLGRLLLFGKARELYDIFKSMIFQVIRGLFSNFELNIHIMSGIGGGTGSGCFIDVCYIMRQVLADLEYDINVNLTGFFFLPDVNLSNPDFPKYGPYKIAVTRNGYAALKELDYLMDIPDNKDMFRQRYNETFEMVQNCRPVDFCYLISAEGITNGYHKSIANVANFITSLIAEQDEHILTIRSLMPNAGDVQQLGAKAFGANYKYNIINTHSIDLYQDMANYLGMQLFDTIKYLKNMQPTESKITDFMNTLRLTKEELVKEAKLGTLNFMLDPEEFDPKVLKTANVGEMAKCLSQYCENWKNRYANQVTVNIKTLGRELVDYEVTDKPESVIGKVFKELMGLTKNPQYGPYYAFSMLKQVQLRIQDLQELIILEVSRAEHQIETKYNELLEAQSIFISSTIDLGKTKKKLYIVRVAEFYQSKEDANMYREILSMLCEVQKHLEGMEHEFFGKYIEVVDKLFDTFENNKSYFNEHANDIYNNSIINIEGVHERLEQIIDSYKECNAQSLLVAPTLVSRFNETMLHNQKWWIEDNESQITAFISSYIYQEFGTQMALVLQKCLEDNAKKAGQRVEDYIEQEIIRRRIVGPVQSATLGLSELLYDCHTISQLFVPAGIQPLVTSAHQYAMTQPDVNVVYSTLIRCKVHMRNIKMGVPIYAFSNVAHWEMEYYSARSEGIHLYESEEKDWHELPSVMPATYASTYYTRIESDKVENILEMYDKAKTLGVIVEDSNRCEVIVNEKLDLKLNEIMADGWDSSIQMIVNTINVLQQEQSNYTQSMRCYTTLAKGKNCERHAKDNLVRRPIIAEHVRREIEKHEALERALEQSVSAKSLSESRSNFIKALMYSIIEKRHTSYIYNFEKDGEAFSLSLTYESECYENIPVYRAFVNYLNLDKQILNQIDAKVKGIELDITEDVYRKVVAFWEYFQSVREEYMSEVTSGKYENENEIVEFLEELENSVGWFVKNNR